MELLLAFSVTLLVAVLISELANRTVISTAFLFLAVGFVLGGGVLDLLPERAGDPLVEQLAELALFAVLFTDGMRVGLRELHQAWELPGRALLLGLPAVLVITALFAHWITGLPWAESFLVGAILSPTDPVFAAAIVGHREVPHRLRHLLNVESGLNDGLALPVVLVLIAVVGDDPVHATSIGLELILGVAVGIAIPWIIIRLEETRYFEASSQYAPLHAFALGLVLLSVTSLTHANAFLAAFAGGVTVATVSPAVKDAFHRFGELVAELFKLASILLFGALLSTQVVFQGVGWEAYAFAVLLIVVARPLSILLSLLGTDLDWREWAVAAWFGPKGFASLIYALLAFHAASAYAGRIFLVSAIAIGLSIVVHSSTDVLAVRWLRRHHVERGPEA